MRLDKLTVKAQEAIQAAQSLADQNNHQAIEPEHLLQALLQQQEGVVGPLLAKLGARPEALARQVQALRTERDSLKRRLDVMTTEREALDKELKEKTAELERIRRTVRG